MVTEQVAGYGQQGVEAGDKPEVPEPRKALVKRWLSDLKTQQDHHKPAFDRMRKNQALAAHGAEKEWVDSGKYVVPIINRHINQSVAQLYAKNPTAVAKRRRKLMHRMWDGRADSLQMAMEAAAMGDPSAIMLLQEVVQVRQYSRMLDRMGETTVALWDYYLGEQQYSYKQQLKAAVRRTKVCGIAYVKLGFQRLLEPRPEIAAQISDVTSKIKGIEGILSRLAEDELDPTSSAEIEELRLNMSDLQKQPQITAREGPIFDFPRATEIIIGPGCRHLKTLAGAPWVAQLYDMRPERVFEVYKCDVKSTYTRYRSDGQVQSLGQGDDDKTVCRVAEFWDAKNRQTFTVVEGYDDFAKEPAEPDLKIDRFWPFFPLVFNEIEHDEELYPPSDVEAAQHMQSEYNRSREGLRQHRIAARPYYVVGASVDDAEVKKLSQHADHEIIRVAALLAGQKAEDLVQRGTTAPIDPNLYEVEMIWSDMLRVTGSQEANLGGIAGGTATESSIAEQSRSASLADNVDDLDEMLSELAHAFGQVLLTELSKQTVIEIVGEGAVWPDMPQTRDEVAKDLLLSIKAGSSGRPNRAAELADMERGIPLMIQLPGVKPEPIARKYFRLLDIDPEEGIAEGVPSITALNALVGKTAAGPGAEGAAPTGDPRTDPAQQGGAGAQNAPSPQVVAPGGQPGYPAPMPSA